LLNQFSAVNKCAPCTYVSDHSSPLPTKGSPDTYSSYYVKPKHGQILLIRTFYWNRLSSQAEPNAGDSKHFALLAFLYPINFFYYFLFYTDTASTLSVVIVVYIAQSQLEVELDGERKLRKEQVSEESPKRNDRSGQLCRAYSLRCLMQQSLLLFVSPSPNPNPNPNPNTASLIL
jgi:DIE2/ALG10 family